MHAHYSRSCIEIDYVRQEVSSGYEASLQHASILFSVFAEHTNLGTGYHFIISVLE